MIILKIILNKTNITFNIKGGAELSQFHPFLIKKQHFFTKNINFIKIKKDDEFNMNFITHMI